MSHYHSEEFKKMAEDTLKVFESNEFDEPMSKCLEMTKLYEPGYNFGSFILEENNDVSISVIESTSTNSSYDMYEKFGSACVLNFASATTPGGGFKNGSVAQEESLARVSGLYYSLIKFEEIYKGSWSDTKYYKDYYIYSPNVPFIKDDNGNRISEKYITVISSAAVNLNKFENIHEDVEYYIEHVMRKRINDILRIAIENCERNIVLGAYGCGVFKNDSSKVASYFKDSLTRYAKYFDNIVFAIYDNTPNKDVLTNFQNIIK